MKQSKIQLNLSQNPYLDNNEKNQQDEGTLKQEGEDDENEDEDDVEPTHSPEQPAAPKGMFMFAKVKAGQEVENTT